MQRRYVYDGTYNIYGYVDGNPLRFVDPFGLDVRGDIANRAAGVGGYKPTPVRPDGKPWGAGCGDKKSDADVPDYFPQACAAHDKCYENQCGKDYCDEQFLRDMKKERPDMPLTAWIYYRAVVIGGGSAYQDAGKGGR